MARLGLWPQSTSCVCQQQPSLRGDHSWGCTLTPRLFMERPEQVTSEAKHTFPLKLIIVIHLEGSLLLKKKMPLYFCCIEIQVAMPLGPPQSICSLILGECGARPLSYTDAYTPLHASTYQRRSTQTPHAPHRPRR